MTDPAPLDDNELAAIKGNTEAGLDPVRSQVLRLIATVEQTRRERDEWKRWAEAFDQARAEFRAERDAAYACIRRFGTGWWSGERMAVVMAGAPRPPSERIWMHGDMAVDSEPMSPAEVDAIRRAQADTPETSHG